MMEVLKKQRMMLRGSISKHITKVQIKMGFQHLFVFLLAIGVSQSIIGYKCGQRTLNKTTISLIPDPACELEDPKIVESHHKIYLTQSSRTKTVKYHRCKVIAHHSVSYCGIFGDSPQEGGIYSEIIEVSHSECEILIKHGRYTSHFQGREFDFNSGKISASFLSHGYMSKSGSCSPGPPLQVNGHIWERPIRNTELKFSYGSGESILEHETNRILFPNNQFCEYQKESCFLPDFGYIYWSMEKPTCGLGNTNKVVVYKGPARIVESHGNNGKETMIHIESTSTTYQILLKESFIYLCGFKTHMTEHPNLFITILDDNFDSFPIKEQAGPEELSMNDYLNSKIVYSVRKVQNQIVDLYNLFKKERCTSDYKILNNMLTLARLSPDDFAFEYLGKPGYTAITMGETVTIFQCDPVIVRPVDITSCYNELVVEYNNQTMFMMPRSRILLGVETPISCANGLRPQFIIGEKWYTQGPEGLVPSEKPEILKVKPLNMKFQSLSSLIEEGLYSVQTVERIQQAMVTPLEDKAATTSVVRSMHNNVNLLPGAYDPSAIFTGDQANQIISKADDFLTRTYRRMVDWGNFLTFCMFVFFIVRLILYILSCLITYNLIKESFGALTAMFLCCCGEIAHHIRHEEIKIPFIKKREKNIEDVELSQVSAPVETIYPRLDTRMFH